VVFNFKYHARKVKASEQPILIVYNYILRDFIYSTVDQNVNIWFESVRRRMARLLFHIFMWLEMAIFFCWIFKRRVGTHTFQLQIFTHPLSKRRFLVCLKDLRGVCSLSPPQQFIYMLPLHKSILWFLNFPKYISFHWMDHIIWSSVCHNTLQKCVCIPYFCQCFVYHTKMRCLHEKQKKQFWFIHIISWYFIKTKLCGIEYELCNTPHTHMVI